MVILPETGQKKTYLDLFQEEKKLGSPEIIVLDFDIGAIKEDLSNKVFRCIFMYID
jgi:hypothetical protein